MVSTKVSSISQNQTRAFKGKLGRKKGKNERAEGDRGSLILFNRAITHS
jgi:hypothetical protein